MIRIKDNYVTKNATRKRKNQLKQTEGLLITKES